MDYSYSAAYGAGFGSGADAPNIFEGAYAAMEQQQQQQQQPRFQQQPQQYQPRLLSAQASPGADVYEVMVKVDNRFEEQDRRFEALEALARQQQEQLVLQKGQLQQAMSLINVLTTQNQSLTQERLEREALAARHEARLALLDADVDGLTKAHNAAVDRAIESETKIAAMSLTSAHTDAMVAWLSGNADALRAYVCNVNNLVDRHDDALCHVGEHLSALSRDVGELFERQRESNGGASNNNSNSYNNNNSGGSNKLARICLIPAPSATVPATPTVGGPVSSPARAWSSVGGTHSSNNSSNAGDEPELDAASAPLPSSPFKKRRAAPAAAAADASDLAPPAVAPPADSSSLPAPPAAVACSDSRALKKRRCAAELASAEVVVVVEEEEEEKEEVEADGKLVVAALLALAELIQQKQQEQRDAAAAAEEGAGADDAAPEEPKADGIDAGNANNRVSIANVINNIDNIDNNNANNNKGAATAAVAPSRSLLGRGVAVASGALAIALAVRHVGLRAALAAALLGKISTMLS